MGGGDGADLFGQQVGVAAAGGDEEVQGAGVLAGEGRGQVEGGAGAQVVDAQVAVGAYAFHELHQQVLVAGHLAASFAGEQDHGEAVQAPAEESQPQQGLRVRALNAVDGQQERGLLCCPAQGLEQFGELQVVGVFPASLPG